MRVVAKSVRLERVKFGSLGQFNSQNAPKSLHEILRVPIGFNVYHMMVQCVDFIKGEFSP